MEINKCPRGGIGLRACLRSMWSKDLGGSSPPVGTKNKMNNDLDKIEEDLKNKAQKKKAEKVSGQSVFKLKEIIQKKAEEKSENSISNN